jgi:hypothetical protein
MPDVAGKLDRHGALRAIKAEAVVERCAARRQDMRHCGQRQHIVDHGGAAEQPFQRGQRRLGAHLAALALDGLLSSEVSSPQT